MSMQKQMWIWAGFLGAILFSLWVFRGILLPFLVGMALAYLLDPVADFLERCKFSRFWATLLVIAVMVLIFVTAFLLLVPLILEQGIGLAQRLPSYLGQLQTFANEKLPDLYAMLGAERAAQFQNTLSELMRGGVSTVGNLSGQVMQSGLAIINVLALLIVSPVVAFYLLLDWDKMVKRIDDLLPRPHRDEIREVFKEMDRAMAGFIRGQGAVVLLLALFYGASLSIAGLNFGLAIGVTAGLLSFVPYVGFLVGFVLSAGVAIVQYWPEGLPIGIIVAIFLVGQFLEGNILYPKLVGSSIGVHPVWLMFSLFAVGILFGFIGLLLAVPMVAIIGVLVRFAIKKYAAGSLYLGDAPPEPQGDINAGTKEQKTAASE